MALGRKNVSVARTDGTADIFHLAGLFGDDNLICHDRLGWRIGFVSRGDIERIVNYVTSQATFWGFGGYAKRQRHGRRTPLSEFTGFPVAPPRPNYRPREPRAVREARGQSISVRSWTAVAAVAAMTAPIPSRGAAERGVDVGESN